MVQAVSAASTAATTAAGTMRRAAARSTPSSWRLAPNTGVRPHGTRREPDAFAVPARADLARVRRPASADGGGPRTAARDRVPHLLRDGPAQPSDAEPAARRDVPEPPGVALPDHAGRARDARDRVDPAAARQAVDRLPAAVRLAAGPIRARRARTGLDRALRRRLARPAGDRPARHAAVVPVPVLVPPDALRARVRDPRLARDPHR